MIKQRAWVGILNTRGHWFFPPKDTCQPPRCNTTFWGLKFPPLFRVVPRTHYSEWAADCGLPHPLWTTMGCTVAKPNGCLCNSENRGPFEKIFPPKMFVPKCPPQKRINAGQHKLSPPKEEPLEENCVPFRGEILKCFPSFVRVVTPPCACKKMFSGTPLIEWEPQGKNGRTSTKESSCHGK